MNTFIARLDLAGNMQSLLNHLNGVAKRAKENASAFGSGDLAYVCGLVHDFGKYSKKFQDRVKGSNIAVDHATAGAQWLHKNEKNQLLARLVAYCCMGHHGGLPDGGSCTDSENDSTLHGRLQKKIEDYSAWQSEFLEVPMLTPPKVFPKDGFGFAFFTRMLFSALVDADCIDAETFTKGKQSRGGFATIAELYGKLEQHIEPLLDSTSKVSSLNMLRTKLLKNCLSAAEKPSRLFTLTAPTGSGKTKSGLAFAFKHAVLHKKRRVIYVAPYNTIIEQNADVFDVIFGSENVLRHYGNHYVDDNENEVFGNKRLSAENWDFPMITTSSVQFFQSLFSNRTSMCRKLHNIVDSVIILDEAQMIPVPFLIPCIKAISELATNYGCTIVLATATQAKLDKYLGITPFEIVENPMEMHKLLRRNKIQILDNRIADSELVKLLAKNEQVLCIVNTRLHAQNLFNEMCSLCGEGVFHLSTTLYPAHRIRVLKEIRQRLHDNSPCYVISTSMVEAGVDVDFPVVYRAETGLDSIVQAAGRCNREWKHPTDESIVYVFTPEEHNPPISIKPNIGTAQEILRKYSDIASPEAMSAYFEQLFYNKGEKDLDSNGIVSALNSGRKSLNFPFRKIADLFRIIEDNTKVVYVLFEKPDLENRIADGERTKEFFRELANYAVSLYEYSDIKKLKEIGALKQFKDIYDNTDDILVICEEYYDKHYGVHLSPEGEKAIML